jgi:endonuclease YncB( thermonuclease family)
MLTIRSLLVLSVLVLSAPAAPALEGAARVIDGDTLDLSGTRIRLHGIDAPERDQHCTRDDGTRWACGRWAHAVLAGLIGGAPVACEGRGTDRYGRTVAVCHARGRDLGEAMVAAGAALAYTAYSADYVEAEKGAMFAGLGLWTGPVERPEAHRAAARAARPAPAAADPVPGDCRIKGNISASGRIYHLPGQRDYDRVRIRPDLGQRWFCSEAEARAAGWRPAAR